MPFVLQRSWVGRRVSVRRVMDRDSDGRLRLGDVVGDLVGLDAQTAVIEARSGLVEVPLAHVTAAKAVWPSTADELALEAVAAKGVRAAETAELGGWLLRADHGILRRANSVLPVGQLRMPLDDALAQAHDWYAERGLPLRIATQPEARRLLDADLGERGWHFEAQAHVMTARLDLLLAGASGARLILGPKLDDQWLAARSGAELGDSGRALLARHDTVVFARVVEDDRTIAIGRGVVDDGWLGISCVEVAPEGRRRGLAKVVMTGLWQWGRDHGAKRSYVQAEIDNEPAIALYRALGYAVHHDYLYRVEPGGPDIITNVTAPASVPPSSTP